MRIYHAGPLFTAAEIRWHQDFKQKLTDAGYEIQWPGDFFFQEKIESWDADVPKFIMERDRAAIDTCVMPMKLFLIDHRMRYFPRRLTAAFRKTIQ